MQNLDPKGSFAKNLLLSLVLIGVTSLLIPLVLKQIDDRKAIDQQRSQDLLTRQDTILDAQANLIDTMAADFWQYEFFVSDLVISTDPRFGDEKWHQRAVETYFTNSGPLQGKMRAEISTLLRLAPKATYDSFLTFFQEDLELLDACVLELIKHEQGATPTPGSEPATCGDGAGKYAGSTWGTLAESVVHDELANAIDQHFADLAQDFRLEGGAGLP